MILNRKHENLGVLASFIIILIIERWGNFVIGIYSDVVEDFTFLVDVFQTYTDVECNQKQLCIISYADVIKIHIRHTLKITYVIHLFTNNFNVSLYQIFLYLFTVTFSKIMEFLWCQPKEVHYLFVFIHFVSLNIFQNEKISIFRIPIQTAPPPTLNTCIYISPFRTKYLLFRT